MSGSDATWRRIDRQNLSSPLNFHRALPTICVLHGVKIPSRVPDSHRIGCALYHARSSGIDLEICDPQVRPQDDFYRHVNGRWLQSDEIPVDRSEVSSSPRWMTSISGTATLVEEAARKSRQAPRTPIGAR